MVQFITFLGYSLFLDKGDAPWTQSVDDWLAECPLLSEEFKDTVLRDFLYQFVTLPRAEIGTASARYATTYFARNAFGEPSSTRSAPSRRRGTRWSLSTFKTYQSLIGLDGILSRALQRAQVTANLDCPVKKVVRRAHGLELYLRGKVVAADHVVVATDPQTAAKMLAGESGERRDETGLVETLRKLKYAPLTISLQQGKPCHMPSKMAYWEPVNTVVDGDNLIFTVWFGPLRSKDASGRPIRVFKSWGTPTLARDSGACASQFMLHEHNVLQPTTSFMAAREELDGHQGKDGIWFAGGWTNWFDSQEAALNSATEVAHGIAIAERLGVPLSRADRAIAGPADGGRERHHQSVSRFVRRIARLAPNAANRRRIERAIRDVESNG